MTRFAASVIAALTAACAHTGTDAELVLSAGAATVFDTTHDAFSQAVPTLSRERRTAFFVGNSFFSQNWVIAPASVEARDGLGPLFNARSCSTCHFKDGRSRPPEAGTAFSVALLRVSMPGAGPHREPLPDPVYGDQIQGNAVPGVPREADVIVTYEPIEGAFADGTRYSLRKPHYHLENLGYGPASENLLMSPRVAPALIGVGLLEAIAIGALESLTDPDDKNHDHVSGRLNVVWDAVHGTRAPGRFGWKAEQPSIRQQAASAFAGDLGITSSVFPAENCTSREPPCEAQPNGGTPEATDSVLDSIVLYARTLAVPARRNGKAPQVRRGEALFNEARCGACHVPSFTTGAVPDVPELGGQSIHPYTDLLLHDLGEGLADDRPAFEADGREWRTAPLWGLGLVPIVNGHTFYLHDGRARTLSEAILWHDGEAAFARAAFIAMKGEDRVALVDFVASL
jgi:CxxC motif-containing protein (DUF1111 family)